MADRIWVGSDTESTIRVAARDAINALCERSGLDVAEVDGFLFSLGRRLCLETEPPRCGECPIEAACGRDVELFQPIFRTTAY